MNNARRSRIQKIIDALEEGKTLIEELREEEQEAFDNMPESIQDSGKGERVQDIICNLENAEDKFTEIIDELLEAIEIQ